MINGQRVLFRHQPIDVSRSVGRIFELKVCFAGWRGYVAKLLRLKLLRVLVNLVQIVGIALARVHSTTELERAA